MAGKSEIYRKLETVEKSYAEPCSKRRSDRVSVEFPIEVVGSDAMGVDFLDKTRAVLVSKHGGKIVLDRVLPPEQEITVLCTSTGKEAVARVVGRVGEGAEGHYYGIAFLDLEVNLWDIEFAGLSESEKAAARVLLECAVCHARKVTYLDVPEAEVLEANQRLSIFCKRCSNATTWLPVPASAIPQEPGVEQQIVAKKSSQPTQAIEQRKEKRLRLCVVVCIRDVQLGDEITKTVDVSRAGFGFKSRRRYRVGSVLQAALPYAPDQANIFTPGRIVHAEESAEKGVFSYGVATIAAFREWPAS
ncbi:MAG TPA: PilZ domain-containing protein [Terriglobia bacterium]|nr:PilZ domain-containing protein [Terriglobia bacterium]